MMGLFGAVGTVGKVLIGRSNTKATIAKAASLVAGKNIDAQSSLLLAQLATNKADASGSWLQRSWRPLFMMVMVLIITFNYFIIPIIKMIVEGKVDHFDIPDNLWLLFTTAFGVYAGGRSIEKINNPTVIYKDKPAETSAPATPVTPTEASAPARPAVPTKYRDANVKREDLE